MGTDINLYAEGLLPIRARSAERRWINIDHWRRREGWAEIMLTNHSGFTYTDLINGNRDRRLFYLLAGACSSDERNTYPPISPPKGLPEQMDELVWLYMLSDVEIGTADCYAPSWLTLGELKRSGYGGLMRLRGWVWPEEYDKAMRKLREGARYQLGYVDVKDTARIKPGMVLSEWEGYISLNLTDMIERLEALKRERHIESDEDVRAVFWFDY